MIELTLKAILTGLILSVMLGPAFFVLIETSIKKGIRAALSFDAGVLIADLIYIVIAYVFFQQVEELSHGGDNVLIRFIGGSLFIIYGLYTSLKRISPVEESHLDFKNLDRKPKDYWIHFLKGLFLNLANPLVIFYWFSVMAFGRSSSSTSMNFVEMLLFLSIALFTFFIIDIIKIVGAKQLRPFITVKVLSSLNRITGTILMIFGLLLILNSVVIWLR